MKKKSLSLWVALAFFLVVIYLFDIKGIKFYLVPSESMEPTLMKSDYIGGFKFKASDAKRKNIVVFTSGDKGDYYVKRIVGLPGETLFIVNGYVYINGVQLDEPYVKHRDAGTFGPLKIRDGTVFLMGDNRPDSMDSRTFGPVPADLLEARISFIYNPISRIGCVR